MAYRAREWRLAVGECGVQEPSLNRVPQPDRRVSGIYRRTHDGLWRSKQPAIEAAECETDAMSPKEVDALFHQRLTGNPELHASFHAEMTKAFGPGEKG
jgi:hypothetical protein